MNYLSPAISPPKRKTSAARRPRIFAVKTEARRGTGPRPTVRRRGSDSHEIKRTLRFYRPKETFGAIRTPNLENLGNLGNPAPDRRNREGQALALRCRRILAWRGPVPRPTGTSRPGGLSYRGCIETRRSLLPKMHQDQEVSPTGVHRIMKHPHSNKL